MDLFDYLGPTREISESELINGSYPEWTKKVIGNLGRLCAITIGGNVIRYAVYLGFAEDNHDYYYRIFIEHKYEENYQEILETCVSGIKFLDIEMVADEDKNEVKKLLENWELNKSQYIVS